MPPSNMPVKAQPNLYIFYYSLIFWVFLTEYVVI
nr:MAG TPA: hypothetical protein [Caudoviricetes sp.]